MRAFGAQREFVSFKTTVEVRFVRSQDAASLRLGLNAVVQLNQTILEAFNRIQVQVHVTVTPRYQWNAIPDKHWGHTDDEIVDCLLVKKRGDELAAAHQPDILAGERSKTVHKWADGIVHKLDAWRDIGWWRMTGEDDGPAPRVELRSHAQARLVGFPAKHRRIDRSHEGVHAIETSGIGAGRQPFDITGRKRDVTVRAGSYVDDNFSALRHEYRSLLVIGEQTDRFSMDSTCRFAMSNVRLRAFHSRFHP